MTFNQMWFILLVDDHQSNYFTKLKKKFGMVLFWAEFYFYFLKCEIFEQHWKELSMWKVKIITLWTSVQNKKMWFHTSGNVVQKIPPKKM
jgi:hypothetical protein